MWNKKPRAMYIGMRESHNELILQVQWKNMLFFYNEIAMDAK